MFTVSGTGKDGTSNVAKYEKGDITRDGVVDLYDAIEIAKYMMNMIDIDEEQMEVGDINNDGVVDRFCLRRNSGCWNEFNNGKRCGA